jgi:potassium efflux system protein
MYESDIPQMMYLVATSISISGENNTTLPIRIELIGSFPAVIVSMSRSRSTWLAWVFLPSAGVALVAVYLDPLNAGWAIGRVAFLILVASLALVFYRLLHPGSGVLAGYMRREGRQMFMRLHRLWYPLLFVAPLALGALSAMGYRYTAGFLLENLVDTSWMFVGLVVLARAALVSGDPRKPGE